MDDAELGPGVRIEGAGSHVWFKRWLRLQGASGAQEGVVLDSGDSRLFCQLGLTREPFGWRSSGPRLRLA